MSKSSVRQSFEERLRQALDALPLPDGPRFAVAFSGGLDSSVLLAAVAKLDPEVRALHVDHGLHPDSGHWGDHCRGVAEGLGAHYQSVRVSVDRTHRKGLEAAAREVRYRALARMMSADEVLLTAHHADDQLETVLLRLVRGAGVRGLRGILACSRFPPGYLARPLLAFRREELCQVAAQWRLDWLEDPANREARHDRNFLRADIVPRLLSRWPAAALTVGRLAAQMAEAETLLEALALEDAAALIGAGAVDCAVLVQLPAARQSNVLRHLIRAAGLPVPDSTQLAQLRAAVANSRADARTRVQWPGADARVFRGRLYLMQPLAPGSGPAHRGLLAPGRPWVGPEGRLELRPAGDSVPGTLPQACVDRGLEVRFRAGGERFRPAGQRHSRALKHWLREAGIVPWMRDRIPLVYAAGRLVAVADRWVGSDVAAMFPGQPRWHIVWSSHTPLQ